MKRGAITPGSARALVTGAGSGIGRCYALRLAALGYDLVLAGNRREPLEAAAAEIRAAANRCDVRIVEIDLARTEAAEELWEAVRCEGVEIDVLINNAGMGCPDGFLTLQDDLWAREIDVNLTAVSEACRLVLPYFRKTGSGCILSTSSLCGRIAATVRSIYAVTKAGVNAYTKALALELTPWHVRVNAVAPGMVGTDMVKANHPDPEDYRSLGGSAMLQRMGEPEEIAAAMVFLASDLSRGINGQVIEVTGGKCVVQDPAYSWQS